MTPRLNCARRPGSGWQPAVEAQHGRRAKQQQRGAGRCRRRCRCRRCWACVPRCRCRACNRAQSAAPTQRPSSVRARRGHRLASFSEQGWRRRLLGTLCTPDLVERVGHAYLCGVRCARHRCCRRHAPPATTLAATRGGRGNTRPARGPREHPALGERRTLVLEACLRARRRRRCVLERATGSSETTRSRRAALLVARRLRVDRISVRHLACTKAGVSRAASSTSRCWLGLSREASTGR